MRENDFHNVTADLVRDRLRELARRLRAERRLHAPYAATVPRKLEDHLRNAGVILQDLLDLLKKRDGALVIQNLSEADHEGRGLIEFGNVPH